MNELNGRKRTGKLTERKNGIIFRTKKENE